MDKTRATILNLFDLWKAFPCVYHPLLMLVTLYMDDVTTHIKYSNITSDT